MTQPTKTQQQVAEEYAESCDNESGSFLSRDLIKIRTKAYLAALQSEEVLGLVRALESIAAPHLSDRELLRCGGEEVLTDTKMAREALAKFEGKANETLGQVD